MFNSQDRKTQWQKRQSYGELLQEATFYARFRKLEKQTWACVESYGWKRQTSP